MAKRSKHRKPGYLRAIAILAWALQGVFAPWAAPPVYAANPDTFTIGMRATSPKPPAAVADLLASPNPAISGQVSISWTAPQGNAGGTPINNLTVASYSVHVATFSVDSLLGDTTAWWNSTQASSVTLQSPANTPQPPGSLEGYTFNGLSPGTTYFFGIRSTSPFGVISPIDTQADTPTQQARAIAPANPIPPPSTFSGVATSTGSIRWTWTAVSSATSYGVYSHPANLLLQTLAAPTTIWTETGLSANTAYSRKVRASDGVTTSSDSVVATVTTLAAGGGSNAPQMPNGLLSTLNSNGSQVTLTWTPVTRDTAGNAIGIDHYTIYRYDIVGTTSTANFTAAGSATSYTDTTSGTVYYYRIQAVSTGGQPSALSDYLDSSSAQNRIAIASDDITTRVVMPRDAASYLIANNNPYGEDLQILLTHRPQDELNTTLRSYNITVVRAANGVAIPNFSFPQNNIDVQLGYGAVISGTGQITINSPTKINAAILAQIISVYWFNGGSYVRVGSPILTLDQSISVTVRNLGIYQIRAATLGNSFRLTQGSPYPRVITPNGAENRRVFWFYENPTGDPVRGEIFDIRGAHVRSLSFNGMSPTANSLVWDGHDDQGAVVPSGIYLYKISTTEQTVTGTVVVAR
jgi:hypothetical protein